MRNIIAFVLSSIFILSLPSISFASGDDFSFSVKIPHMNVNASFIPPGPVTLHWVDIAAGEKLPRHTVIGGFENGQPLFVCHARYNGGVHPGKVVGNTCNISWGGNEIVKSTYQVLVSKYPLNWEKAGNGFIPDHAIQGGYENGHPLFICQAKYKGGIHPGKVVGATCNFGYAGKEILKSPYKVLAF